MPAEDLVEVLNKLPSVFHRWLSSETGPLDDAAVVYPDNAAAGLVLTLDIITPIVDDATAFGRIAAANAISDVYALGGEPQVALSFVGMPEELGLDVLEQVMRGMSEKASEAGCAIVGGHTMRDAEPKCGLAVIGSVERGRAWTHKAAAAGQSIVLTKPIGTGVLAQALRAQRIDETHLEQATRWMEALNRGARDAGRAHGVTTATDVTGFGLLGHLKHIVEASGLSARIRSNDVPILGGALDAARRGLVPGGSKRNARYVENSLRGGDSIDPALLTLLTDAQTSGGLLLGVDNAGASRIIDELSGQAWVVGRFEQGEPGSIVLE